MARVKPQIRWQRKMLEAGRCGNCGHKRTGRAVYLTRCFRCLAKARARYHARKAGTV